MHDIIDGEWGYKNSAPPPQKPSPTHMHYAVISLPVANKTGREVIIPPPFFAFHLPLLVALRRKGKMFIFFKDSGKLVHF